MGRFASSFPRPADRDAALSALSPRFEVTPLDVPDEDWARRSQEGLGPVTVGRIVVAPPWAAAVPDPSSVSSDPSALVIVIEPSMGFGTGHHVTTRLCLAALQAIAARASGGARRRHRDPACWPLPPTGSARRGRSGSTPIPTPSSRRATTSALNPDATRVRFETIDLAAKPLPVVDVVTANLTGALLIRSAPALLAAVRSGGTLILSGIWRPRTRRRLRGVHRGRGVLGTRGRRLGRRRHEEAVKKV